MLRAGAPLGIYNGLKSVGEGNSADAVALNIVEGILAGSLMDGGMQILESLAGTYLPKAGAALYEKWLAGGKQASVFTREAREAMANGLAKELRLAGKEYEAVWGGVKDATPVENRSVPSKTATLGVDGKLTPDLKQSVPTNGKQPILYDDMIPSAKEGNPGVKVEDTIDLNESKTPGAAGSKVLEGTENLIDGISITDGKVGGKIPVDEYKAIRNSSIKNPDADSMTFGKFKNDATSYTQRAGTNSSYFDMGSDWSAVKQKYGLNNNEMFDYFNRPALDDAIKKGKNIRFSHNPLEYGGSFLAEEWEYIKEKQNLTDANLVFDGGFWYAR